MPEPGPFADEARHLQLVNQQMQLMERAVLELGLNERANQKHPRNRGWMNLFRAWSQSQTFQKHWALNIAYYSDVLQTFCYYALGLELGVEWRPRPKWEELTRAEQRLLWHELRPGVRKPKLWEPVPDLNLERVYCGFVMPRERWAIDPRHDESAATPVAIALLPDAGKEFRAFRVRDTYRWLGLSETLLVALECELKTDFRYGFENMEHEGAHALARVAAEVVARRPHNCPSDGAGRGVGS